MELRHLRYFAAVAETRNFTRAAERQHVAQPALSRQIRDLETQLGVQLFERDRAHVLLTDAGRVFQAHVAKLLLQVDMATTAAQEAAQGDGGRLVIGNDWRLSVGVIPATVAAFRTRYPRVAIELAELRLHEQLAAVRAGRAHLGFVPREFVGAHHDLELLPVARSEIVAVLGTGHVLAGRHRLRVCELRDEKWCALDDERARGYKHCVVQLCRLAGFTPTFDGTAASLDGVLALIASGHGVTLLPRFVLPDSPSLLRYLSTDCEPLELCAVWRRGESSRLLRNYLELLRANIGASAQKCDDEHSAVALVSTPSGM